MKPKLALLMSLALIISINIAAFAKNQKQQGGQMHNQGWHQQDPNQLQDPNQPKEQRRNPQEMMAKRTERTEKQLEELRQIRETAQSENATKTVAALDKMIDRLQTEQKQIQERQQEMMNRMNKSPDDANQPGNGPRFRGGKGRNRSD